MAKVTKQAPAAPAAKATPTPVAPKKETAASPGNVIDLSKLTAEQLIQLQKQLKAKKKEVSGKKDERFNIIDTMLAEKDEDSGEHKWTTRDIVTKLAENNLIDTTAPDYYKNEIKKVQARKQFLEKQTDKEGKLVAQPGTYGYKPSSFSGFSLGPEKVVEFFQDENKVATLTGDQRNIILKALS